MRPVILPVLITFLIGGAILTGILIAVTNTADVDWRDELGCTTAVEQSTDELFVAALYECRRDGKTTDVYTFTTTDARDSWRVIAEDFGAVVLNDGDTWLEVQN